MSTILRAPHPNYKVTTILPNPEFNDSRSSESTIIIKRTMTGRKVTYTKPSERYTLTLSFELTRMKSLELEAFINSYQSAPWLVELYDGSQWDAQLVDEPVSREATERIDTGNALTGNEMVVVTLTLSATRVA